MVPETFRWPLTTDTLEILLPGIVSTYGSGQPVDVFYNVTSLGNFLVSEANEVMSGTATLVLDFYVETVDGTTELAASLQLNDSDFEFNALVSGMDVQIKVTHVNVDSVDVLDTSIGDLSAFSIKVKINNGFRFGLPLINRGLESHMISIPSNIFGLFLLSDLTIDYHDNYIYAGATPTFVGPSSLTEVMSDHSQVAVA